MSAETKKRINPFLALIDVFSIGADYEDVTENFTTELKEGQKNSDAIMQKSAEPLNVSGGKANRKGGFGNKINPKTEEARREYYQKLNDNDDNEKDKADDENEQQL